MYGPVDPNRHTPDYFDIAEEGSFVPPPGPSPAPGLGLSIAEAFTNIRDRLRAAQNNQIIMTQPEPPVFYAQPVVLPEPAIALPTDAPREILYIQPQVDPEEPLGPPEPGPALEPPAGPLGPPTPVVGPNGPNGPAVTLAGIDPRLALILGLGIVSALLFSK